MTPPRRSGRRPGDSGTREAILAAARSSFGAVGFRGTTIRGVAASAGVDPALVHHFFGTKQQLFVAAMELPVDPSQVVPALLAGGVDGLGERLVDRFLGVWDAAPEQQPLLGLLRGAMEHEESAAMLREFLTTAVLTPLARAAGGSAPELRADLVAAQMLGLALTRYVLRLEPVASADAGTLARAVGPTVQRYLTEPDLGAAPGSAGRAGQPGSDT